MHLPAPAPEEQMQGVPSATHRGGRGREGRGRGEGGVSQPRCHEECQCLLHLCQQTQSLVLTSSVLTSFEFADMHEPLQKRQKTVLTVSASLVPGDAGGDAA